jgi:hypothetical protein
MKKLTVKTRTLHVKKVTRKEIEKHWKFKIPIAWGYILYVRCNAKGEINWPKTLVYHAHELLEREKHVIH